MPSPTELSDTILDALIEKYGAHLSADVFTDEQGEQLAYLQFADGDRYVVRIDAHDDYPADQEFMDERTGAHAMITAEELRVYTGPHAPEAYRPESGRAYIRYPLERIQWVTTMSLPGGQTAVAMGIDDAPKSPGLTFSVPSTAVSFQNALQAAASRSRRAT